VLTARRRGNGTSIGFVAQGKPTNGGKFTPPVERREEEKSVLVGKGEAKEREFDVISSTRLKKRGQSKNLDKITE